MKKITIVSLACKYLKSLAFKRIGGERRHVNLIELVHNVSQKVSFRKEIYLGSHVVLREGRVTIILIYLTYPVAYITR